MECLFNLDASILLWIQENIRTPWLTVFFKAVTSLGNAGIFWILLSMGLIIYAKTRQTGIRAMTALVISFVINNLFLKNVIARTRPYEVIDELKLLIAPQWDYSFPSGHAGSSFAAAMAMFLKLPRRYGIPALIGAALIAVSRLYVGVHYPTDVLVGTLTGILIAILLNILLDKLYKKIEK